MTVRPGELEKRARRIDLGANVTFDDARKFLALLRAHEAIEAENSQRLHDDIMRDIDPFGQG